ncbi:nitrous oxide reductase accessory protein NosL [Hydrogenimonas thermophila]|uniref:nitrous oxide reductase accessory protein NosL n=1 Tax=Hydrogenimonas thermophila TaxID=223786 RepID=UPI0029374255|nr:nitrous oxide reductase accessory protein NosL [Hydrogenimonas thermophila]WOE70809.1 nitrous oxide reductase accessory protein NosL [Hydrogenimonas thermophila]WOE73327.1 nitrous oxide reductase accessory protein NosL [Hydrogenimonas thermophila]
MREFKTLFLVVFLFLIFSGCEKKDWKEPVKVHWDRDMCERCKMAISERKYAVQVIDPKTHKHYKFDDIGCTILWFKEENISNNSNMIIWVKDGKYDRWIDARKAYYSTDKLSPMGYGFTAFKKREDINSNEIIEFNEVEQRVLKIGR